MEVLGWFDGPKKNSDQKKQLKIAVFFSAQEHHGTLDPPAAHFFCY